MITNLFLFSEEIANLKHYFSIQAIRYAGSFHVNYEIPEELERYMLPKLILQPLAENSVLHGSYNDGTIMEITIRCIREWSGSASGSTGLRKGI